MGNINGKRIAVGRGRKWQHYRTRTTGVRTVRWPGLFTNRFLLFTNFRYSTLQRSDRRFVFCRATVAGAGYNRLYDNPNQFLFQNRQVSTAPPIVNRDVCSIVSALTTRYPLHCVRGRKATERRVKRVHFHVFPYQLNRPSARRRTP